MPNTTDELYTSTDELLKAAGQLSETEFERFASEVWTLRARRRAPSLSADESKLLAMINKDLPRRMKSRIEVLTVKRAEGTLTRSELGELKELTDKVELVELKRAEKLAKLARLRKTNISGVMKQLGIRAPEHA